MGTMIIFIAAFVIFILGVALIFKDELKSTKDRDPAATNVFEVLFTYAGLHALILHRIAHFLLQFKIPLDYEPWELSLILMMPRHMSSG